MDAAAGDNVTKTYDPGVAFEVDGLRLRIDDGHLFPWCEECSKRVEYCNISIGQEAGQYSFVDDYVVICHGVMARFSMDARKS